MSKPKPPSQPSPQAVANAQTQSNQATARTEATLNRYNQETPYGNVTWTNNGGDRWTQTTTESPTQRELREIQEQQGIELGQLGLEQTGRVQDILGTNYDPRRFNTNAVTGGPLDIAGALGGFDASRFDPTGGNLNLGSGPNLSQFDPSQALGDFGSDVRQRSFDLATQGMDRAFDRSEESLRSRLAAQGVNAGSEAFGAEMDAFNTGKGNAFAQALLAADTNALRQRDQAAGELQQGAGLAQWARSDDVNARLAENSDALTRLGMGFDQNMSGRQQQLSELLGQRGTNLGEAREQYGLDTTADLAARQNPLNEIIALMSGVQTNPINPGQPGYTGVNGTDVAGIYGNNYANQMAAYQQQMAGRNSLLSGLASLGGAAIGAPWLFGGAK